MFDRLRLRIARRLLLLPALVTCLGLITSSVAEGQGLTASIEGTITDSGQGVLPGVTVTLVNEGTNAVRTAVTDNEGVFRFPNLLAGTYTVKASLQSFKPYEQRGITLSATDRMALRSIVLEVGSVTEQVTVQADAALVETTNGARAATVERSTIDEIASKGRLLTEYVSLLPGVINTSQREFSGSGAVGDLNINGRGSFNFTIDGVTNKDTGANGGNYATPALDSIAEIRVQTSSFQAEYGRSSGATITVVTRSGSKDFHGSLAFYKRDESFNENEYDRKYNCSLGTNYANGTAAQRAQCDKPIYRYNNTAWTLGGPVLMPGSDFNRNRDKLFFFFSQDLLPRHDPGTLTLRRVPTDLERRGDFSQTRDTNGNLVFIKDPLKPGACSATTQVGCFTDNKIPTERLNAYGQNLVNLLPLPNQAQDAQGNNHSYQSDQELIRTDQIARVDWNVAPDTTFYTRVQWGFERSGNNRIENGWPVIPQQSSVRTWGIVNTLLKTFNPTTVMEATVGLNWSHQDLNKVIGDDTFDKIDRRNVLAGWDQFFPEANIAFPVPIVPGTGFNGGISPNVPGYGGGASDRFPFWGYNRIWNLSGNVTKLKGTHNMKIGAFLDYTERPAAAESAPYGNIQFTADNLNQCNTQVGIANALIGCVQQYTESDRRVHGNGQFTNLEWYLQDNWRVKRNFTLDYGLRIYHITPAKAAGQEVAQFIPTDWSSSAAPALYKPVCATTNPCSGASRLAVDPTTGKTSPAVNIGRLVPGSGDPYNGQTVYEESVFNDYPKVKFGPRAGFAWDVNGDGRTAIRGGAGVYYDRFPDHEFIALVQQPPLLNTYTLNFTTISELQTLSAGSSQLLLSPRTVSYWPSFNPPVTYNWNLNLQREIRVGGFVRSLVADFAYVGSASRNQLSASGAGAPAYQVQLNGQPLGYKTQAAALDPTNVSGGITQPLPDDLLRPYQGVGSIVVFGQNGYADYHSLQLSLNRRAANGLSIGLSYTYQIVNKALRGVAWDLDENCQIIEKLTECGLNDANRDRFYNSAGRRPHTAIINWSYFVPDATNLWDNGVVRAVLNDWRVSGVTQFQSGAYGAIGWAYTNGTVPTGTILPQNTGVGSGIGSRVHYTCDPNLPRGERTFERQFRTECVGLPTDQYNMGDSKGDEYQGLGYSNWDITFAKIVPMRRSQSLEFRVELYNAFNTNQWSGVNSTANFSYATGQLTNLTAVNGTTGETEASFGALNRQTRTARRIQLGVRYTF